MARRPKAAKPPKPAPAPARVAAFEAGLSAESRAAAYLIGKGYQIIARRVRTPRGELDIVCGRRQTLVFVEVKARATLDAAAESLLPRQQSRIVAAAEIWLAANPEHGTGDIRFDAVLVAPGQPPRHIEAAFMAE